MSRHIFKNGSLILGKIDFEDLYSANVKKGNGKCGVVYVPKKLIGKNVYVIVKEKIT